MRRKALWVAALLSLLAAGLAFAEGGDAPESYRQYVGRLRTSRGGCTAFPIHNQDFYNPYSHHEGGYRVLFLTAGHCVTETMHYEQPEVTVRYGSISIRYPRSIFEVRALAVSRSVVGHDIAVLGAVLLYPLPSLDVDMLHEPYVGEPLLLASFGRGAWMSRIGPFVRWDEDGRLVVNSTASPGSSGAPVIVPGTRKAIGIGVETSYPPDLERSPLACRLSACPPQPPYYAVSVRRLPGLIKWPPKESQ